MTFFSNVARKRQLQFYRNSVNVERTEPPHYPKTCFVVAVSFRSFCAFYTAPRNISVTLRRPFSSPYEVPGGLILAWYFPRPSLVISVVPHSSLPRPLLSLPRPPLVLPSSIPRPLLIPPSSLRHVPQSPL